MGKGKSIEAGSPQNCKTRAKALLLLVLRDLQIFAGFAYPDGRVLQISGRSFAWLPYYDICHDNGISPAWSIEINKYITCIIVITV